MLWKLDGLDDEQLRRPMTPSGTNLLGVVKHLAVVEFMWFCVTFDRPAELQKPLQPDDEDALRVEPNESTADIVGYYERARAASNAVTEELDLDTVSEPQPYRPGRNSYSACALAMPSARDPHDRGKPRAPRGPPGHRA